MSNKKRNVEEDLTPKASPINEEEVLEPIKEEPIKEEEPVKKEEVLEPEPKKKKKTKEKKEVIEKDGLLPFHYHKSRDAVFTWIAFPVLFEINKVQRDSGDDWMDISKFEDSKYKKEIKTLLYLIENYDNIEVQESRNGYILNKDDLIKGHFFNDKLF